LNLPKTKNQNGCVLSPSISVKLLGVMLNRHCTFSPHIDAIVKKAHDTIGLMVINFFKSAKRTVEAGFNYLNSF